MNVINGNPVETCPAFQITDSNVKGPDVIRISDIKTTLFTLDLVLHVLGVRRPVEQQKSNARCMFFDTKLFGKLMDGQRVQCLSCCREFQLVGDNERHTEFGDKSNNGITLY